MGAVIPSSLWSTDTALGINRRRIGTWGKKHSWVSSLGQCGIKLIIISATVKYPKEVSSSEKISWFLLFSAEGTLMVG